MTQPYTIRPFDPFEGDLWNDLVGSHPAVSFFHCNHWARVLQRSYGHHPLYVAEMNGEAPRALLPILEVNSPWTGRRGVSLPFSDDCGLLCFDDSDGRRLVDHGVNLGRERGWKYFELRGEITGDPPPARWKTYLGHEIDLTVGIDALFNGLESRVRRAIRKAEKAGLTTRLLNNLEATQIFYALHCRTRRKHGVPPQPFFFFQNICDHVLKTGKGFIIAAEYEGRTVAASVFVHHGRSALYKFGASDQSSLSLRPNTLVMWEAIRWYVAHGYTKLSMGRTAPGNAGLRFFKCGFGATEKPLNYYRYDFRQKAFVSGDDEKVGKLNKFLTVAPLPILRIMGRTLYPHLD